jgi:hypothetical protein
VRIIEQGDRELRRIWEAQQHDLAEGLQALRRGKQILREKVTAKAQSKALEVMPAEAKILYVKTLAAQSLVSGQADPKKVADVYLFMSQIDLQPDARIQVRQFLEAGEAGPSKVLELASKTVVRAGSSRDEIAFSLVKDMVRVSRVGGGPSQPERESIVEVALEFGYDAEQAISLAEKAIEHDEAFVAGEVSIGELEKRAKQLAAQAASVGVPIAAVYVSGSVVGLSAAGITSGLAWLGLGGLLGLSSMLTGIGVVILIGAGTYAGARRLMGGRERELKKRREHMIQEVIKRHQKAIADLADDINTIAAKLEEYISHSDRNEERLTQLEGELRTFRLALKTLQDKEQQYAA